MGNYRFYSLIIQTFKDRLKRYSGNTFVECEELNTRKIYKLLNKLKNIDIFKYEY